MTSISTTNLPSGLTNAQLNSVLSTFGTDDPALFHVFFNDFNTYTTTDWTNTSTGTTPPAPALVAGDGGILGLVTAGAATNQQELQSVVANFQLIAGQQAWFKMRLALVDATNSQLLVGLINITTTPFTPAAVTDGIYFTKASGSTALVGNFEIANSSQTVALPGFNMANSVYANLGWHYDGNQTVQFSANGNPLGQFVITAMPTTLLSVTIAVAAGTAAAQTMDTDYLFAATERPTAASA